MFYTFSKNLGGDMIGLGSYYLFSPLNIIFLFFNIESLPNAVLLLTLIKIGLSGLTMNIFLNHEKKLNSSSVIFSSSYALMAYNIVYQPHIMWLDGVILLPLIILGIEKLRKKQQPLLYVLSLGGSIVFCYYIGFMLCIFSILYFCCSFLFFQDNNSLLFKKRERLREISSFGLASLLGAGLSSFILLPALASLQGGKSNFSFSTLTFKTNFPFFDLLSKLYSGSIDRNEMISGLPNIYCGMFIILFSIMFFVHKQISFRKKLGFGLLLLTLLISFYINSLNLIWHGFNHPSWFPYRYSFIFSFILITIAFQGYMAVGRTLITRNCALILISIFMFSMILIKDTTTYLNTLKICSSIFLILILLLLLLYAKKHSKSWIAPIFCICILDLGINAYLSLHEFNYAYYDNYINYVQTNEPILEYIKENDPSFYRLEKTYLYNHNDSMMFNYRGLTHFSSSEKQFVKNFMGKMGFRNNGTWAYYNQGSTISTDSLLGIKYLLTENPITKPYELLWQQEDILIYKNPYALPLGFMVSENVINVTLAEKNLFELQNNIWKSMIGISESRLFYPEKIENITLTNLLEEEYENGIRYIKQDKYKDAFIEYYITIDSTDPLYAYFPTKTIRQAEIFVNDESLGLYFDTKRYDIIALGKNINKQIIFKIKLNADDIYIDQPLFYYQDMDVFQKYYNDLSTAPYIIKDYTGSYIEGQITNSGNKKYVLFTIPYEEDWSICLDGKPASAIKIFDTLIAIEIPEGTHSIILKYVPKYLYLGLTITIISGAILFCWFIISKNRHL